MTTRKLTLEIIDRETNKTIRTHHFKFESDENNFLMLNVDGFYHKLNFEGVNYYTAYCKIAERQAICDVPFLKDSCSGSFNGSSHIE